MDYDVELTYRLGPPFGGITASFKLPALTDDVESAVESARNLLDRVVGSALDNADPIGVSITAVPDGK